MLYPLNLFAGFKARENLQLVRSSCVQDSHIIAALAIRQMLQ
jgi:hypothetical protein